MLTKIAIYCFLYPLSLLPLSLLYGISFLMRVVVCDVLGYRKKVVRENLLKSFPNYNAAELEKIEKQFYQHLCNIFVEGVKLLTMSKSQVKKRYRCLNADLVNAYFERGRSVILMSAHYNNWEWMVLSLSMQFSHHGVGVGKANSNKVFEKIINKARTRYGTEVVFADTVRDTFEQYAAENRLCAYMMLSDQSPATVNKSYITTFLHQPSAMIYGGEYFAKKYDYPVLYYVVKQPKRGYYTIEVELLSDKPNSEQYGGIIEKYVAALQRDIESSPSYWLWSHRRWKHKISS